MTRWTVSGLVAALRQLVEGVPEWRALWVEGELSGVKAHISGHWYFTLKDASAQLRCVMFRKDAERLRFRPQDGQAVAAFGRLGVFERDGQTQLYVSALEELGSGWHYRQLEALRQKLEQEGLFSRPKRRLPLLPRAVGLITSPSGAARFDVETVVRRRFPSMPIVFYPVLVQGEQAAEAIVAALQAVSKEAVDVVILGRGGGSREDLMAFNDERVVRAAARCPVPLVSAVGHQIDVTLTDLVADLRAETPSAAAELVVPEYDRLLSWQRELARRAEMATVRLLAQARERLRQWAERGVLARPEEFWRTARFRLERLEERKDRALERALAERRLAWERLRGRLLAVDPQAPLERGYAFVTDGGGNLVGYREVVLGQRYQVHWYNGSRWMQALDVEARRDGQPGADRTGPIRGGDEPAGGNRPPAGERSGDPGGRDGAV